MRLALIALPILIAACDRAPDVPTAAENSDLDDIAEQLDNASGRLDGIDPGGLDGPNMTRAAPEDAALPGSKR